MPAIMKTTPAGVREGYYISRTGRRMFPTFRGGGRIATPPETPEQRAARERADREKLERARQAARERELELKRQEAERLQAEEAEQARIQQEREAQIQRTKFITRAPEPRGFFQKPISFLYKQEEALEQRHKTPAAAPLTFGLAAGRGVLQVGQAITHPIPTAKGLYYAAKDPVGTGRMLGRSFVQRPVSFLGETAGTLSAGKVAQTAKVGAVKVYPKYKPTPQTLALEQAGKTELLKKVGKAKVFYSVQEKSFAKVDPKIAWKGAGRERRAFARRTGQFESFQFVSPDRPAWGFGFKPRSIAGKTLPPKVFGTKRPTLEITKQRAATFKQPVRTGTAARASLVKEVKARPQEIFAGTKGAAGKGTEVEAVFAGRKYYKKEFLPTITLDPTKRIVPVKEFTLKPPKVSKKPSLVKEVKTGYKEYPLKERFKPSKPSELSRPVSKPSRRVAPPRKLGIRGVRAPRVVARPTPRVRAPPRPPSRYVPPPPPRPRPIPRGGIRTPITPAITTTTIRIPLISPPKQPPVRAPPFFRRDEGIKKAPTFKTPKQPKKYRPTYYAAAFKFQAPKIRKAGEISGLGVRPTIKKRKKKKR